MPKIPDNADSELIFDGDEENLLDENLLEDLDEGGDDEYPAESNFHNLSHSHVKQVPQTLKTSPGQLAQQHSPTTRPQKPTEPLKLSPIMGKSKQEIERDFMRQLQALQN